MIYKISKEKCQVSIRTGKNIAMGGTVPLALSLQGTGL